MSTALRTYYRGHTLATMRDEVAGVNRNFYFDHQGTTQCLTDDTGAVTDRFSSDAWGVQVKRTGTSINRHWYIGNLGYCRPPHAFRDYVRERHLDNDHARWLSADVAPVGRPYVYSQNSASKTSDASGRGTCLCQLYWLSFHTPVHGCILWDRRREPKLKKDTWPDAAVSREAEFDSCPAQRRIRENFRNCAARCEFRASGQWSINRSAFGPPVAGEGVIIHGFRESTFACKLVAVTTLAEWARRALGSEWFNLWFGVINESPDTGLRRRQPITPGDEIDCFGSYQFVYKETWCTCDPPTGTFRPAPQMCCFRSRYGSLPGSGYYEAPCSEPPMEGYSNSGPAPCRRT